jgi:hypothetical protein
MVENLSSHMHISKYGLALGKNPIQGKAVGTYRGGCKTFFLHLLRN